MAENARIAYSLVIGFSAAETKRETEAIPAEIKDESMSAGRRVTTPKDEPRHGRVFIDLFAGCGGLTLGLLEAGWHGLFGIDNQTDAFATYKSNFLRGDRHSVEWPDWLEPRPWDIKRLLAEHSTELRSLRGSVDLVCGGPPCQGFSFSGRRNPRDPRNQLFRRYVDFVDLVRPKLLLLENVPGFGVAHGKKARGRSDRGPKSYAQKLRELLEATYVIDECLVRSSRYGVPQIRDRYFAIGVRKGLGFKRDVGWAASLIEDARLRFLTIKGLPTSEVSARTALRDLELTSRTVVQYERDLTCNSPSGFQQVEYKAPRSMNSYLGLMRSGLNGQAPSSLRLPRHTKVVARRFKRILQSFPKGRRLNDAERERLGLNKLRVVPLCPDRPAHTVTTLPDDLLHYSEPRILTVRECARLQSFPDWFDFHGKYTTGGDRRTKECPRYTQVGNAVPPLVAEAWGFALNELFRDLK